MGIMKSDSALRRDVERELEWEPSIDERRIGVSAIDGVVTLTGEVSTYAEKLEAQRTVERVAGVRGVVNELKVQLAGEYSDTDIAKAAVGALRSDVTVPADRVKVKVDKVWVTLTGDAYGDYQRRRPQPFRCPGRLQPDRDQDTGQASRRQAEDRGDAAARRGVRREEYRRHRDGWAK